MKTPIASVLSWRTLRVGNLLVLAALAAYLFLLPGVRVVRDLSDPALRGPGVPDSAWRVHRSLSPRIEAWARERIASGHAEQTALHDVPTNEWPMFTAVFYLLATEELQASWARGERPGELAPVRYAANAISASRDLLVDPTHHSWVRRHWGDGYLHREDVFFRSLLIASLTSHEKLMHDGTSLPMLRDQVETLAQALDSSKLGLLHDYPQECYPIDVLAAVGFIRKADDVLGTDHGAFVERELRAFDGAMTDSHGLVPYRFDMATGEQVWLALIVYFGVGAAALIWVGRSAARAARSPAEAPYPRLQAAAWLACVGSAAGLLATGQVVAAAIAGLAAFALPVFSRKVGASKGESCARSVRSDAPASSRHVAG